MLAERPEPAEFQFYPTPTELVFRLIAPYHGRYGTALEPSAGRGDTRADAISKPPAQANRAGDHALAAASRTDTSAN